MSDASSSGPRGASDDSWWTDEPAKAPDDGPPRRGGRRPLAIAGAVVIVIAAAVGGFALATRSKDSTSVGASAGTTSSNGPPSGRFGRRPGAQGTIDSISGSNLTVTTAGKATVNVVATSKTTITDTTKGALTDLKTGDHVRITGATGSSGVVTAQLVLDTRGVADQFGFGGGAGRRRNGGTRAGGGRVLPEGGTFPGGGTPPNGQGFAGRGGPVTAGTIASIDSSTIVVKTTAGKSVKASTSSSSMVRITTKIALSDLAKGDTVTVTGATANGTLTATAIRRGDIGAGFGFGIPGGRGAAGAPGAPGGPTTTP